MHDAPESATVLNFIIHQKKITMKTKLLFIVYWIMFTCHAVNSNAQANRQLSNLISPTAVNVNLLPGGTAGTKNLGSNTKRWKNGYFNGSVYCYGADGAYGVYGYSPYIGGYGVYGYGGTYGVSGGGGSYGVFGFSSGWAGYFNGKVYSSGGYTTSAQKLKQNIRDFTSAIDIINKLKPKQYEFRQDGNYKLMNLPKGRHFGLIAQDVEKVLPDLINDIKFETATARPQTTETALPQTQESAQTETKSEIIEFKALNYTELIPVLIKGMQELDQKNTKLEQENAQLKSELEELKQLVNQYIKPTAVASRSKATLGQNYPNPFTKSTVISFSIPKESNSANIVVTQTGSGRIIKTSPVSIGTSQLTLDAASLAAGAYAYTLYVDGKKWIQSRWL